MPQAIAFRPNFIKIIVPVFFLLLDQWIFRYSLFYLFITYNYLDLRGDPLIFFIQILRSLILSYFFNLCVNYVN